ncbi:MAG: hypothetical protein A2Y17_04760 [Clostridiales bacterium GWF2_38_85]|nr:MAG: hypothetical protein A2Y17_04760 [Clostridiales bacterium GWF2_38_85]HBL84401.1 hypothetical protein [Clostridiales bacterium]
MIYSQIDNEYNLNGILQEASKALFKKLNAVNDGSKWRNRLASLDEKKQKYIASKYYGGHMPWKE